MLAQDLVNDFSLQCSNVKFLSYTDEIMLTNKLKVIHSQQLENVPLRDIPPLFSNIYTLLTQSGSTKSGLLEVCLDILLDNINHSNTKIKKIILSDSRFISVLISNIMAVDDDKTLMRLLMVIRELLNFNSELNEHNLKLTIEVLKGHIEHHDNREISILALDVLSSMCLKNPTARYLVQRAIKSTSLHDKISELAGDLVAIKIFVLLEDEFYPRDMSHFIFISLTEVKSALSTFNTEPLRHSLQIFEHMKQKELGFEIEVSNNERIIQAIDKLAGNLVEIISSPESKEKSNFIDGIFEFFTELLELESRIADKLENFTESMFLSAKISKSANALKYLSSYMKANGSLSSSEIIVESILDQFIGNNKQQKIDHDQKCAFLNFIATLDSKEKLGDVHLQSISDHFDQIIESFQQAKISALDNDDIFHFIHFLSALWKVSKRSSDLYVKLRSVLKADYLPVLVVKAQLSWNEEIMMKLVQLSAIEDYPNKKIVSLLSKCATFPSQSSSQSLLDTFKRRDVFLNHPNRSKNIENAFGEDIDKIITQVNKRLDSNELSLNTADVVELYRQKINFLNDHLTSTASSVERITTENAELQHKIVTIRETTEKQEFMNLCLQLDITRMSKEIKEMEREIENLKLACSAFQNKLDKFDQRNHESVLEKRKIQKEMHELATKNAITEKSLEDTKNRLRLASTENENRIVELKQKLSVSENDVTKLQELRDKQVKEIVIKQEQIVRLETEIKEGELMKNTIMSLMQTKSFKK